MNWLAIITIFVGVFLIAGIAVGIGTTQAEETTTDQTTQTTKTS